MDARVTVKQNSDFRRIYRRGRSAVSGGVVVYCLKNRQGMSRQRVTVYKPRKKPKASLNTAWASPSPPSWATPWSATVSAAGFVSSIACTGPICSPAGILSW